MIYEATLGMTADPVCSLKLEGGPWSRTLTWPIDPSIFDSLCDQWGQMRGSARDRPLMNLEIEQIGAVWGDIGWPRELAEELTRMREYCAVSRAQLRLRMAPEAHELPAESWRLPGDRDPLAFDPLIRLCRWTASPETVRPAITTKPRVLLAFANPATRRYLRIPWLEEEIQAIGTVLRSVAEVQIVVDAVPAHLEQRLRDFRPHVFHFSGHGEIRPNGNVLIAQGPRMGVAEPITAPELATWLRAAGTSIAVLSACDTYGLAADLVEGAGVLAAIGMQLPFRVGAAPAFSRTLYGALADGKSLDDALVEARQILRDRDSDWLAPLIYTRSPQTHLLPPTPLTVTTPPKTPHNLGGWERSFVGRRQERETLRRLLLTGSRLVVVTGFGGMGKSRLTRQVGEDLLHEFPDGVWMVSAANAQNVAGLITSIRTVALPDTAPSADLAEALAGRRMLLILDACESLRGDPFSEVVLDLLERAPTIAVLVSSRVHLGLPQEVELPLGPLSLPSDPGQPSDSLELLLQTIRESHPSFHLSDPDRRHLETVCREVDGIPLALILAASRLRYVGLSELVELLREGRIQTLASSQGGSHASIGRVLEASVASLSPDDLHFLWCLSVFHGGFTLADMVAVHKFDRFVAMDAIGRLNDHCLLETERVGNRTRYHILETISDFIQAKSQVGDWEAEWEQIRYAHAAHYVGMAERAARTMEREDWGAGARSLWGELGNLRAAMRFAIEAGHWGFIRTLAHALALGLFEHGLWSDLDVLLDAADRASEHLDDPKLLARMLGIRGGLVARRGDLEGSRQIWERRAEVCGAIGDLGGRADALLDVITREIWVAPLEELRERLVEAAELAERAERPELVATAYAMLALLCERVDDQDGARSWAERAHRVPRPTGAEDPLLFVDVNVGRAFLYAGELGPAEQCYLSALSVAANGERRHHVAAALHGLALVYAHSGRPVVGLRAAQAATNLYQALGSRWRDSAANRLRELSEQHPSAMALLSPDLAWRDVVREILRDRR